VHGEADVAAVLDLGLARVQADAHPRRRLLGPVVAEERPLGLYRTPDGEDRSREGGEEGVSLRVDDDAGVALDRFADEPVVRGEDIAVALAPERVQQPGRALDVGEEEGDGAARKVAHAHMIALRLEPGEAVMRCPRRGQSRMCSAMAEDRLDGQIALVTGGGRGIGANIARELTAAGAHVAVSARSKDEAESVAAEIGGLAVVADVSDAGSVEAMVREVESGLGPIDLLCANAGVASRDSETWTSEPADWWRTFEVNVLGVYLCCRAVIPGMLERGGGRIVITGSGASYLPGSTNAAYSASKAAVRRFGEILAQQLEGRVPVFVFSPGLVRTDMTSGFPAGAPWTPPELAPRLVRVLASGHADALAGRYIHAEHDDVEELIRRADEIRENDLNAIRLQR
jgi:3-oxoacyl-[acyl-carrier protein] reductase